MMDSFISLTLYVFVCKMGGLLICILMVDSFLPLSLKDKYMDNDGLYMINIVQIITIEDKKKQSF